MLFPLQLPFVNDLGFIDYNRVIRFQAASYLLFDDVGYHRIIISPLQEILCEFFSLVCDLYQDLLSVMVFSLLNADYITWIQELKSVIAVVDGVNPATSTLQKSASPIIQANSLVAVYCTKSRLGKCFREYFRSLQPIERIAVMFPKFEVLIEAHKRTSITLEINIDMRKLV